MSYWMRLEDTPACNMRDELEKLRFAGKITLSEITERMSREEIPDWLRSQIIGMCEHNQMKRCTDPIEQAMFQAVCNHIVKDLLNEDKQETTL